MFRHCPITYLSDVMPVDPEEERVGLGSLSIGAGSLCQKVAIRELGDDLLKPTNRSAHVKWPGCRFLDHIGHQPIESGCQARQGVLNPSHVLR